jgi:protein gp37
MGNWIPDEWINQIIERISQFPQHTYLFLSKNPMRYREFTWPDNAKLGMSITNSKDIKYFPFLNFISFEPLLDDIAQFPLPPKVQWYIVGGLTPKPIHEQKWIDGIVAQADEAGIPVFIKENAHYSKIRQDFPLWNGRTEEGGT